MSSPDWDKLIEESLASEPFRPAPVGLYRRINRRLHLDVAIVHERRRMRNRALSVVGVMLTLAGLLAAGMRSQEVLNWLWDSSPGMMGYSDYLRSFYWNNPTHVTLIVGIALCAGALLAVLAGAMVVGVERGRRYSH